NMSTPCASVNDSQNQGPRAAERAPVRTEGVANTSQLGGSPSAPCGLQPGPALPCRAIVSSAASLWHHWHHWLAQYCVEVDQCLACQPRSRRGPAAEGPCETGLCSTTVRPASRPAACALLQ